MSDGEAGTSAVRPSRALLVVAGAMTQLIGGICFIASLVSLPMVHDGHGRTGSVIASALAAVAAIVCGTLVYRARLVPMALAMGLDVGFGIALPRGNSAISALLRILPGGDARAGETLVTVAAVIMFLAGIMCVLALPSALRIRRSIDDRIRYASRDSKKIKTLEGIGPARMSPTQIVLVPGSPNSRRPVIIVAVATTFVVVGVVLVAVSSGTSSGSGSGGSTGSGPGSDKGSGRASTSLANQGAAGSQAMIIDRPADAADSAIASTGSNEAAIDPTPQDLLDAFHAALGLGDPAGLAAMIDVKAFAFGAAANEIAEGRDAVVALLRHDIAAPNKGTLTVEPAHVAIGRDGEVMWIAEEVSVGSKRFLATAIAGLHDGHWMIFAVHWAVAMPNDTAYTLAREGSLAMPDAIPDAHDDSPLAAAMRAAFASRPSFVEARSMRPDSVNFGSALGERILGGDAIRKTFTKIKATIRLHDAVKVRLVGERGGWGAANVDFTDTDRDGNEVTQTFRVLAAWVREDAGWRIVQTQWSNAR